MAELRANPSANRESSSAAANWPVSMDLVEEQEELPRGFIELHGLKYLAFCKAWAPLFIKPDDDDAD